MEILNLIIKQVYFDQIIAGTKKIETREVRPTTQAKYVTLNSDDEVTGTIKYDAIRFFVGYGKNRNSALVECKGSELIVITDENDNPIMYDYKGQENMMINIEYKLGNIIEKSV